MSLSLIWLTAESNVDSAAKKLSLDKKKTKKQKKKKKKKKKNVFVPTPDILFITRLFDANIRYGILLSPFLSIAISEMTIMIILMLR